MAEEKILPFKWTRENAERYEQITGEWPKSSYSKRYATILSGSKAPIRTSDKNQAYECRSRDDDGDFYDPYDPDGFEKDD